MVQASLQIDEQTLAQRMSQGDEGALRMVLVTFGPKVKGCLLKHFGGALDRAEIDEAFNVAAFNVWRFADRFDQTQGSFGGWFLRIAQRAAERRLGPARPRPALGDRAATRPGRGTARYRAGPGYAHRLCL